VMSRRRLSILFWRRGMNCFAFESSLTVGLVPRFRSGGRRSFA
jgi:hypothetical protein